MKELEKLVKDCMAMDISNQLLTFDDAFLPNKAAAELQAKDTELVALRAALTIIFQACSKLSLEDMNKLEKEIKTASAVLQGK